MTAHATSGPSATADGLTRTLCVIAFLLIVLSSGKDVAAPVWASEPAAMVEQVANGPDGLSNFDYLYPGRVIDLGKDGALSLIYFQKCIHEDILGGRVIIREDRSDIQGAVQLRRRFAGCGRDDRQTHYNDLRTSAAMVFRSHVSVEVIDHLAPRFETSDQVDWISIVEIPSDLEIFRLERPKKCVDLSDHGVLLTPGGVYRVQTGRSLVMFRVDPNAKDVNGATTIKLADGPADKTANDYP